MRIDSFLRIKLVKKKFYWEEDIMNSLGTETLLGMAMAIIGIFGLIGWIIYYMRQSKKIYTDFIEEYPNAAILYTGTSRWGSYCEVNAVSGIISKPFDTKVLSEKPFKGGWAVCIAPGKIEMDLSIIWKIGSSKIKHSITTHLDFQANSNTIYTVIYNLKTEQIKFEELPIKSFEE